MISKILKYPLTLTHLALYTVVTIHALALIGMVLAFPVLIWEEPWYIWLPLCSWILNIAIWPVRCPLTIVENALRKKLGLPTIRGFIVHNYELIRRLYEGYKRKGKL